MLGNRMAVTGFLLVAALASGCDSPATRQKLAQLEAVSAEKDSLLALAADNSRLMSEISATLARVREVKKPIKAVAAAESPLAASMDNRDSIKAKITEVVERLTQAEARLAASQRRIKSLGSESDSLKSQFAMMEQSVADLRSTMETQRTTITQMTDEMNGLKVANAQLTERTVALTDTVSKMDSERNTVYYVVGTKEDLKKQGVLVEEGSQFLFFGKKTVAPARDLTPEKFTAVDKRQVAEIPLPKPDRSYMIVSRQNLTALGTEVKNGAVKGTALTITEPERFWAPSKYLIIIEG